MPINHVWTCQSRNVTTVWSLLASEGKVHKNDHTARAPFLVSYAVHVRFISRWCFGWRNPGETERLSEPRSNHGYRLQNNHRLDRKGLKTIRIKRRARGGGFLFIFLNLRLENRSVSLVFSLGEKWARAVSQNSEAWRDDSPFSTTCEMLGAVSQMPVLHSCSATTSASV